MRGSCNFEGPPLSILESCIKTNEEKWFKLKDPSTVEFPTKDKILNDPIYGTIRLEKPLVFLIDLPCFQRLRRIRQLGFTDLVYPGAHHTRFEHSIGTAYLSKLFLSNMKQYDSNLDGVISSETIVESQIASLYHDIGHLPYSHVTETLLFGRKEIVEIEEHQKLEDAKPHEILSSEFVKGKYISKAIERINNELGFDLNPNSISGLILGNPPAKNKQNRFLGELLHGTVDVDRMDYLTRDAKYTGVPFGKLDLGRLVQTITVHKGYEDALDLVAEIKGIQAIESLIVARTLMYSSVYHHHTSRAASALFQRLIFDLFNKKGINHCELCNFDDQTLFDKIESYSDYADALNPFRYRNIPKIAISLDGRNLTDFLSFDRFSEKLDLKELIQIELSIDNNVLLDIPKYAKYDEIGMYVMSKEDIRQISEFSSIAKGIESNKTLNWIGYVFAKTDPEKIATSTKKYFKENSVGITV